MDRLRKAVYLKNDGPRGPKIALTKSKIAEALEIGLVLVQTKVLVQSTFGPDDERSWVDELIREGRALGCWAFEDNGSTRMVRAVRATGSRKQSKAAAREMVSTLRGQWILETPSDPSQLLLIFRKYGLRTAYLAHALRREALKLKHYPAPLTPQFLYDVAIYLGDWGRRSHLNYKKVDCDLAAQNSVRRAAFRITNPNAPVERYLHIDNLLAWHGLAPLLDVIGTDDKRAVVRESAEQKELLQRMRELIADAAPADKAGSSTDDRPDQAFDEASMSDSVSEDECVVCSKFAPIERALLRENLGRIPTSDAVCKACEIAFWRNIGVPVRDDDDEPPRISVSQGPARIRQRSAVDTRGGSRVRESRTFPPIEWLERRIDVDEIEKYPRWERTFKGRMTDRDELWEFCSPAQSWENLGGRMGVALVRDGRPIAHVVTVMN